MIYEIYSKLTHYQQYAFIHFFVLPIETTFSPACKSNLSQTKNSSDKNIYIMK